jgi:hypothetical protein
MSDTSKTPGELRELVRRLRSYCVSDRLADDLDAVAAFIESTLPAQLTPGQVLRSVVEKHGVIFSFHGGLYAEDTIAAAMEDFAVELGIGPRDA